MITLLSPAKSLDFDMPAQTEKHSQPELLDNAVYLNAKLRKLSAGQIQKLMSVNGDIASLNHQRFAEWGVPFTMKNAKQAILAFRGDVYRGLDAVNWKESDLEFAQDHIRILSGLYGVLKPLDLMQPYRLEMGTRFKVTPKLTNLYKYWDHTITDTIVEQMDDDTIINLASNEYFKSFKAKDLNKRVITCHFKDLKDGEYKSLMTYAKLGRGYMGRYIVQNRINTAEDLKNFNLKKYGYNESLSDKDNWVFTRDEVEL